MSDTTSLSQLLDQAIASQPSAFGAGIESTSIEDESIGGAEFDTFKLVRGKKERISFLTPKNITHGRTHYVEGSGFLVCLSEYKKQGDKEVLVKLGPCCQHLDRSRKRCVALVLQYHTDQNGKLIRPFGFSQKVWRFNEKTFSLLRTTNAEHPLDQHDLIIALDGEEKYQGAQITPAKDTVISQPDFVKQYQQDILAWVTAMQPQLDRAVGRRIDAAKWAEILKSALPAGGGGRETPSAAGDNTVEDLESLLNK